MILTKNTHYFPMQYSPTFFSYGVPVLSERYELHLYIESWSTSVLKVKDI